MFIILLFSDILNSLGGGSRQAQGWVAAHVSRCRCTQRMAASQERAATL